MKKNFFKKKLASALAIALVVASVYPAGITASAAAALKIVDNGATKATSTLYVGSKVNYDLSKQVAGTKYTWTISNSKVAAIASNSGVVVAKAPGVVTVKVTATPKTGTAKVYSTKLTVKQRATSVDAGKDVTVALGDTVTLKATVKPATSTDAVRYFSGDKKVATVASATGVVTPVAPGKVTITVYSKANATVANSSKGNKSDTVEVTVVDTIKTVKQTTPSQLQLTFGSDQSKTLKASDLTLTDANSVKQIIKGISFSADGKTVTVNLYVPLTDAAAYKLTWGTVEKSFTASKGDVASVVVESKTVQYGVPTAFSVKLFDKNGVDVTSNDLLQRVTFEYDNTKAYIDSFNVADSTYKITVFNYGESVAVKATYHTYTYGTDYTEVTYPASGVINSVKEIPNTATGIAYTLSNSTADWANVKTAIPAGSTSYKLFVKGTKQDGTALTEVDFTYESTDSDILTVNKVGSVVYVYPGKQGTAYIKATYGGTVQLLPVTVGASSTTAIVTPNKNNVVLYSTLAGDVQTVTLTGKDQYGSEVSYAGQSVGGLTPVAGPSGVNLSTNAAVTAAVNGTHAVDFTLGAVTASNAGTYTFQLTLLGKTTIVYVNAVNVTDDKEAYIGIERSTDTVDAVLNANTTAGTTVTFTTYSYNAAGQKVAKVAAPVTVKFNGSNVPNADTNASATTAAGVTTLTILDTTATAKQATAGTYVVEASYTIPATTPSGVANPYAGIVKKATSSVVVKNTQTLPVVARLHTTASVASYSTLGALLGYAFEGKINGGSPLTIVSADVVKNGVAVSPYSAATTLASGDTVYVKSITFSDTISGQSINYTVNVGLSVNLGN